MFHVVSYSLGDVVSAYIFSITFGSAYCCIMSISPSIGDVLSKCCAFVLAGAMPELLSMLQCFPSTPACRGLGMF